MGTQINNNKARLQHYKTTFPTLCEKCMGSSLAKQYREDAGDSLLSSSKKIRMPNQLQIS